jgi:hypothetical protein
MPNSLLTLGSFAFEGLESPDGIILKSKQRLAVHHLGSGSSIADALGEDCQTVTFRGVFSGLSATARIRAVELLRVQGLPVVLAWDSQTLSVLIQEFDLTYSSSRWVSYRLSCLVVQSPGSGTEGQLDPIFASPATQANDLASLLLGSAICPTSGQITAIVELATINYDSASAAATEPALALLGSIDTALASGTQTPLGSTPGIQETDIAKVQRLADEVTSLGQCAYLTLARNRLMSIIVQAGAVNTQ